MIAVTVRHDHEVELGQTDAFGLRVLREHRAVAPGIEQDALASVFDKGGVAPILGHRPILAEGIVEYCDARCLGCRRTRLVWPSRNG